MKTRRTARPVDPGRPVTPADLEQAAQLGLTEDRGWVLRQTGRLHSSHRASSDLALVDEPAEEAAQGPVAVVRGRRRPLPQELRDERLDVLTRSAEGVWGSPAAARKRSSPRTEDE